MIQIKRVYERTGKNDGARFLVERLWPRGVKKEALRMDGWLRGVAPSTDLRKWFSHDAARWDEFQRRYRAELEKDRDAWQPLLDAARHGSVTLLFSSHDTEHNNAIVLKKFLKERLKGEGKQRPSRASNRSGRSSAPPRGCPPPAGQRA